uniref:Uncharacterized protein n=1 Tax=Romanomermis culicivorax TaxID=13658 RepID=A0A915KJA0_ROMCU
MTTPLTTSTSSADEPPLYRESINVNERYVRWAEQQPHKNDLSFACDTRSSCQNAPIKVTSPSKPPFL